METKAAVGPGRAAVEQQQLGERAEYVLGTRLCFQRHNHRFCVHVAARSPSRAVLLRLNLLLPALLLLHRRELGCEGRSSVPVGLHQPDEEVRGGCSDKGSGRLLHGRHHRRGTGTCCSSGQRVCHSLGEQEGRLGCHVAGNQQATSCQQSCTLRTYMFGGQYAAVSANHGVPLCS